MPTIRSLRRLAFGLLLHVLLPAPAVVLAQSTSQEPATRAERLLDQRRAKAERLEPETLSTWERRLLALQEANFPQSLFAPSSGFHPVIGGLPPGSGFVAGLGYVHGATSPVLRTAISGRLSTGFDKALDAQFLFPTPTSGLPVRVTVDLGYRDLRAVEFFGLGNGSRQANESSFGQERRRVRVGLGLTPHRMLDLGVSTGYLNENVSAGADSPTIGSRFDLRDLPGALTQPDYLTYGARAELRLRDRRLRFAGVTLAVDVERFEGRDSSAFDFTRVVGELQAHVPLGYRNRMLAFRARTSHSLAESGAVVPIHVMETIGGSKTLRGFDQYRYRDARNLLMSLEYRWEVWNYADLAIFGDAGKVFADASSFDLSRLQAGYGVGIRTVFPGGGGLRIDLARSNEGVKLHIGGGPRF